MTIEAMTFFLACLTAVVGILLVMVGLLMTELDRLERLERRATPAPRVLAEGELRSVSLMLSSIVAFTPLKELEGARVQLVVA